MHKRVLAFITIVSLSGCLVASAQVKGLVVFENARQGNAIIKNRNVQTFSNDLGEFSIVANIGDTLVTTKEGLINDTLVVTNTPIIVIRLKKGALMLKEVNVHSTALTPEKILTDNKAAYKEIYRKGDKSNAIVITPLGVGVVIDKVWSAVSKEGADARRLQRTFIADYENSIIDKYFNKTLVSKVTGYRGVRLLNFMSKYRPEYKVVKNYTEYEMFQYIKKCFKIGSSKAGAIGR